MGVFGGFLWGSGVLYGSTTVLSSISPDNGPSIGGNAFVLTGQGFDNSARDDDFTGAGLDPLLWTDISFGSGAVSTGANHLQLSTGTTPASVAGVISVFAWADFQAEVRAFFPSVTAYPATSADVLVYWFWIGMGNYAELKVVMDSTGALTLNCNVVLSLTAVDSFSESWTNGLSVFKILRYQNILYFVANGTVVHTFSGFGSGAGIACLWAENDSAVAYDVTTTIESFTFKSFVVFDDQPVHDAVTVSDTRMRGFVPASVDDKERSAAYAGLVDVHVVGDCTSDNVDAYEYYYLDSLRVVNSVQSGVVMSFINDDQIKTKTGVKKGIGL